MCHVALYFVIISNSSRAAPCNNLQRRVNTVRFTSQPSSEKSNLKVTCSDNPKFTMAIVFLSAGKQLQQGFHSSLIALIK